MAKVTMHPPTTSEPIGRASGRRRPFDLAVHDPPHLVRVGPEQFVAGHPAGMLGHAAAGITLDTYGHLIPDELDVLAARLEDVHARALADVWPHDGPAVIALREDTGQ
jgi:hypothetical protein